MAYNSLAINELLYTSAGTYTTVGLTTVGLKRYVGLTTVGLTKLCEGLKGSAITSLECAAVP